MGAGGGGGEEQREEEEEERREEADLEKVGILGSRIPFFFTPPPTPF